MGKKDEIFVVKKTEQVDLNFYAVRSQDGKWFRSKGMNGYGESWVEDITKAKIYLKPGPAKAQITFWSKNYPEFGIPDLVRITTGVCEFLDQTDRVNSTIIKIKTRELEREIRSSEYRINNYIQKTKWDQEYIEKEKLKMDENIKELNKLKEQQ
jgi:hypothetical protein